MERKLATIRRVSELKPIIFTNENGEREEAQNIQLAMFDGWQTVVLKNEFNRIGQLAVYFEIDSIIPREDWNLHINKNKIEDPIRLKTTKLKGYLSQGLALPVGSVFRDYKTIEYIQDNLFGIFNKVSNETIAIVEIGGDVSELLNVTKYEPPVSFHSGMAKGNFPFFIPKTDQERIQNIGMEQIINIDSEYLVEEKLDGTSITIYKFDGEIGVCSRNLNLKESDESLYWSTAKKEGLIDLIDRMEDIAFQGELIGPNVQGNRYKRQNPEIYLFDIFDIKSGRYYTTHEKEIFCRGFGVKPVPVVNPRLTINKETTEDLLLMADGRSQLADTAREGFVFRSINSSERFTFKVISNKFLLKNG